MRNIKQLMKLLLRTITFFFLVSSIVWPALSYCDDFETHDHQTIQELGDKSPANNDLDRDCDHCCHMSLHLLGIVINNYYESLIVSNQSVKFELQLYPSGFFSPPLRPPSV